MTYIREWRNEEWEHGETARDQFTLQKMARKIMENAEKVENEVTIGSSRPGLSRVITCTSSLLPNTEYIIHISGFTIEDIIETIRG